MLYKRRTIIINVMLIELGAVTAISAAAAHLSKYLVLNPIVLAVNQLNMQDWTQLSSIEKQRLIQSVLQLPEARSALEDHIPVSPLLDFFQQRDSFHEKVPKLIKFYLNDGISKDRISNPINMMATHEQAMHFALDYLIATTPVGDQNEVIASIVEASPPKIIESYLDRAETTSINRSAVKHYYESLSDNRDNIRSTAVPMHYEKKNRIEKMLKEEQRHKKSPLPPASNRDNGQVENQNPNTATDNTQRSKPHQH